MIATTEQYAKFAEEILHTIQMGYRVSLETTFGHIYISVSKSDGKTIFKSRQAIPPDHMYKADEVLKFCLEKLRQDISKKTESYS